MGGDRLQEEGGVACSPPRSRLSLLFQVKMSAWEKEVPQQWFSHFQEGSRVRMLPAHGGVG